MTASVRVLRFRDGQSAEATDTVVREQTLALVVGGHPLLRFQCLPVGVEDLALGLLVTSGLLRPRDPVPAIEYRPDRNEIHVALDLPEGVVAELKASMTLGSGCGSALSPNREFDPFECSRKIDTSFHTTPNAISRAMHELMTRSEIFRDTGAVHSAGIAVASEASNDECRMTNDESMTNAKCRMPKEAGAASAERMPESEKVPHSSLGIDSSFVIRHSSFILSFAEDIGRHNAFDKAVGACRRQGIELYDKIGLVTGRLSLELIAKAVPASLPVIVSRGAPTDAAVRLAHQANLTLVGFARAGRMNVYAAPWRIQG